jgi:hypothetical protein
MTSIETNKEQKMIDYICDNITVDNDSEDGMFLGNKIVVISVPECASADPLDRYDHLVAVSGALENALERGIRSFSYKRIEDVT